MQSFTRKYAQAVIGSLSVLFLTLFFVNDGFSQEADSSYVKRYKRENDIETYSDWRSYRLRFLSTGHAARKDFSLVSNSMLYTGVNLDYKWLSIGYGFNVPGTERDRSGAHRDLFLQLNDIDHLVIWQAYFKKYNGLLEPLYTSNDPDHFTIMNNHFNKYTGVHLYDAGVSILYPLNHKTFSYNAAQYLNRRQLRSAGSVLLSFNPFYHKVTVSDSLSQVSDKRAVRFLTSSPQWFTGAFSLGYAYNFIGYGKWSVSPEFDMGYGVSRFLKPSLQWHNAVQYNAVVTVGYSSPLFYSYLTGYYHNFKNNFAQEGASELNSGFSITCGYRVGNLKKKILHLL
ncbi:MAG: DUF4421 family protein [Flavisolibacter sp.]